MPGLRYPKRSQDTVSVILTGRSSIKRMNADALEEIEARASRYLNHPPHAGLREGI